MTARRLIPEEHFSLKNPETIAKIISLSNTRAIITLFHHPLSDLETVLNHYNFKESLNFVQYIKKQYSFESIENLNKLKKNSCSVLNDWEKDFKELNPLKELNNEKNLFKDYFLEIDEER